jgi:hypothetical protein
MINPPPTTTPQSTPQPTTSTTNQVDVASLLKILQKMPPQQQQLFPQQSTPPRQPVQQTPLSDLERTIGVFRQQQSQPTVPQLTQLSLSQTPASQLVDFQKILAVLNAQKQMQPSNGFQQPQPAAPSNLAAIISQFTGKNQSAMQSQPQQQNPIYEDPDRKRMREGGTGHDGPNDDKANQTKRTKTNGDPKQKKHVSKTVSVFPATFSRP